MTDNKRHIYPVLAVAILGFSGIALAGTVTGGGSIGQCTPPNQPNGVIVNSTTITWLPPGVGINTGCTSTGGGTAINWTAGGGGSIGSGAVGDIMNLTSGPPANVDDFLTFAGTPLDFVLTGFDPITPTDGTNCVGLLAGHTCVVNALSPFQITGEDPDVNGIATETTVTLSALGFVGDTGPGASSGSHFKIVFSTNLSNLTPGDVQTMINSAQSIESTYSGNLTISAVPEPATLSLLLGGMGLLGLGAWRRRKS